MGNKKPECVLEDGNVYLIIAKVIRTLSQKGMIEKAIEFRERAFKSESYDAVLRLCFEYVDVC